MTVKTLYQAEDGQLFETYHAAAEHNFIETLAVAITECPTVFTPNHSARSVAKHLLASFNIEVKKSMKLCDDSLADAKLAAAESAISPNMAALLGVTE